MIRLLDIYITSLKNSFASRMAYRGDFFICCFITLISEMLLPFITLLIYATGASLPGWSLDEIMVLQGVFMLSRGLAGLLFFGIVYNTLVCVREGTYDLLMIKPVSVLFLSITTGFEPDRIGTVAGGVIILALSMNRLQAPGLMNWLYFAVILIFSVMTMFSFAVMMAATVFKWVGNSRIFEIFESVMMFGNYPKSIFSQAFQTIISYIIPVSIIAFYPASALIGKGVPGLFPTLAVCVLFLIVGLLFWRMMLSKYTSAGG